MLGEVAAAGAPGLHWPHKMRSQLLILSLFLLSTVSGLMPPVFESNMTLVTLPEDLPEGHIAFRLVARDTDNDQLYYGMEGTNSYHFTVNETTGYVTLKVPLDYEIKPVFPVFITVDDRIHQKVVKTMTVIVSDCNDNAPVFQNTPYVADIMENSTMGSSLFNVTARDADEPDVAMTYSIMEVIPRSEESSQLFLITESGVVILNGSLSYNKYSNFYQLKINATDSGGLLNNTWLHQSSIAYISFNVIDVPDLDPQFLNVMDMVTVLENSALGTSVLTVSAIDGDKGVDDEILYSIGYASVPGLFNISSTGEIFVSGLIDREELLESNEQVLLTIVAQEAHLNIYGQVAETSVNLTVRVLDVNDNKPHFYNCELPSCNFSASPQDIFLGEIEEHSSPRVPVANLSITAYDPDKDFSGTFELFLRGPDAAAFSVSPHKVVGSGTIQVLVSNSSALDFEAVKVMNVEIVANDSALATDCCSFANVTIHLLDVNDHSPEFADSIYKLHVKEHCQNGTVLTTITATDEDSGIYGEISYWLLPEAVQDTFTVNISTGEISVSNGDLLDRETRALYYATLQALDGMKRLGTTLLEITILDINDNAPTILGSYNAFVNENTGRVQLKIQASDNDDPGSNNSIVHFEIIQNPFSANFSIVQESGLLTNRVQLDREAIDETLNGKIVLLVRAYDLGEPQQETFVNVTITVEDLNDNAPEFSSERYQFSVKERERGVFVGSVNATDRDQTEVNNRISFQIVTGSFGNFLIRSTVIQPGHSQGRIWLDPEVELDYETQQMFTLTIEAQDLGINNVNQVNTTVTVLVEDVNDEAPIIDPSSPQDVNVWENKTQDRLVTTLIGSDKDTNHSLIFEKLFVKCFQGTQDVGNVCSDWFQLFSNGSVMITEPLLIDYETCDLVEMKVQVLDILTEVGRNHSDAGSLKIHILDINDNSPVFLPMEEVSALLPGVKVKEKVAEVNATDLDTGVYGKLNFSITHLEFLLQSDQSRPPSDVFSVATTSENSVYTGILRLEKVPDFSKGGYRVTVQARDGGSPPLSAQKELDIFAVDKSYEVRLEFTEPVSKIQENLDTITMLLKKATRATVYVQDISPIVETKAASRAVLKSFMLAYFVFSNGTAIRPEELTLIIQTDVETIIELRNLGLSLIVSGDTPPPLDEQKYLIGIIAGLVGALVLVLLIMVTALVCVRKSFRRQLKALKALKVAKTVIVDPRQQGPSIPGTNKYTLEGANPVLNLSLVPNNELKFDEQSSNTDTTSLNSLDENTIGYLVEEGHGHSAIKMNTDLQFLVPDGAQQDFSKLEEPLSAALQHHKNTFQDNRRLKASEQASFTFTVPPNTTDL
ncbi:cadherin-related family member 2 isoform X2 [Rhinatrema bivittatum]|uniref:cadherin-related family member 2 isoform X2 n=1 Tax=Rhinatrema bivittatum TaxID=194408 RepID=UPI0011290EF7|nr:cadherin-related family member 2 isoform X2 [Rhinatrema bivittatum]